ncbi:MAG: LysE family transporter [Pseudooceanicola sp.]|nr:LysE family transporter [Pseudooceanicola sp.]
MIAEHLPAILLALSIHAAGLASPGPNILTIIGTAMARGRKDAAAMSLGVAAGTFVWATLTVLGLSALIAAWGGAMIAVKVMGAAYLAWLSYRAFRNAFTPTADLSTAVAQGSLGALMRRGLLVQLSNPKAAFTWIAIVTLGLGTDAPAPVAAVFVLLATLNSLVIHLAYAVTFSTRPVVAAYRAARRWIEGAIGLFLAFASFKIATARL